ncbi:MAG: outer membrane protein assembly factor BamD [Gemmatimonadales bacterium]
MRRWLTWAALGVGLTACWPFGGGKSDDAAAVPAPLLNSPRTLDSLWTAGQVAFNHGDRKKASEIFTRLGTVLPVTDARHARLLFFQAEIALGNGLELDAVRLFRRVSDEAPDDSLAPDALVRAGDAYSQLWRKPELDPTYGLTALGVYQEVASRYPGTPAARRAEARVQDLNEKFAYKDYKNALFYYQYKAYESAILNLRALIAQYPRAGIVPEALEKLVASYQVLGYQEDIRETCQYIAQFHPDPEGPLRLCPAAADSVGGS